MYDPDAKVVKSIETKRTPKAWNPDMKLEKGFNGPTDKSWFDQIKKEKAEKDIRRSRIW